MSIQEVKSRLAGRFALENKLQYYQLKATRPSRRRSGVFVYWFNRFDHKEVTFVSCDETDSDIKDLITIMSYEA